MCATYTRFFLLVQSSGISYQDFIIIPKPACSPDSYKQQNFSPYQDKIFPTFDQNNHLHDSSTVANVKEKLRNGGSKVSTCYFSLIT